MIYTCSFFCCVYSVIWICSGGHSCNFHDPCSWLLVLVRWSFLAESSTQTGVAAWGSWLLSTGSMVIFPMKICDFDIPEYGMPFSHPQMLVIASWVPQSQGGKNSGPGVFWSSAKKTTFAEIISLFHLLCMKLLRTKNTWTPFLGAPYMGMDQYLLIPCLGWWTSIYQLFWGSLGTRVLTHPHMAAVFRTYVPKFRIAKTANDSKCSKTPNVSNGMINHPFFPMRMSVSGIRCLYLRISRCTLKLQRWNGTSWPSCLELCCLRWACHKKLVDDNPKVGTALGWETTFCNSPASWR